METTPAVATPRSMDDPDHGDTSANRAGPDEIDYASVVAEAADWTTVTGTDGRYRYVSPACRRLVGWTESELLGSSADDFVHPDDVVVFRQAHAGLTGGEQLTLSYRLRCRDGSFRWVEETCELVRNDDTWIWVSTVRDITQRQASVARWSVERRLTRSPA